MQWISRTMDVGGAAASRSKLRDAMSRLRAIRRGCGKEEADGEVETTGDPFKDKIVAFSAAGNGLREMILARNEAVQSRTGTAADVARDSHEIHMMFRQLDETHREIAALVDQADREVARANRKGKADDKVELYERTLAERRVALESCGQLLNVLHDLDGQRNGAAAALAEGGTTGRTVRPQMREQLAARLRRRRGAGDEEDGAEMGAVGGGRLGDAEETRDQMKALEEKQRQQDAALDGIRECVGRITETATAIGMELDKQDEILKEAENKMNKATVDLQGINRSLTKLAKERTPMTIILIASIVLLVLGLTGYLLHDFGVIPSFKSWGI